MSVASSRVLICISLTVAVGWLAPCAASAHRFGGPNDPCERKIGTSLIHITLYQPEFDPDGEYCNEVPRAGNTVLVVDVLGDELRKMPLGVQVLATRGPQSRRTVLSIPPKIYRRGVADAQAMLDGGGTYLTRISVGEGAALQVLSFPIRVAPWYRPLMVPALVILGIVAFIAFSTIRYYWTAAHDDSSSELPHGKSPRSLGSVPREHRRASGSTVRSSIVLFALITCLL